MGSDVTPGKLGGAPAVTRYICPLTNLCSSNLISVRHLDRRLLYCVNGKLPTKMCPLKQNVKVTGMQKIRYEIITVQKDLKTVTNKVNTATLISIRIQYRKTPCKWQTAFKNVSLVSSQLAGGYDICLKSYDSVFLH